jgi:hypothetical protein
MFNGYFVWILVVFVVAKGVVSRDWMAIVATYFEFNTTVYGVVLFCTLVALHRDSTELFYAKKNV